MRIKFLLFALLVFIGLTSHAQLQKGSVYADLSLGQRYAQTFTWHVQPGVSYALSNRFSVGTFVDYTRYQRFETLNGEGFGKQYSVGISVNYFEYFNSRRKWGLYYNGTAQYSHFLAYDKTNGATSFNYETKFYKFSLTPGIFHTPSDRIIWYGNIGGVSLSHENNRWKRGMSFLGEVNVGMHLRLGKKRK